MFRSTIFAAGFLAILGAWAPAPAADAVPAYISKAVADATRPDADKARDADRKPGESLAFAGLKEGDKVAELLPGGGYFTRILAKAVGPVGKVYAIATEQRLAGIKTLSEQPGYANVALAPAATMNTLKLPEPVDLVWTSQNYHDLHNANSGTDINAFNKSVYDSLKPGGIFIVLDHTAAKSVDFDEKLHRIDPERVKKEVTAAGFKLVGQSDILKNPADDGTKPVFDPSVRGKTNQFILKFQK